MVSGLWLSAGPPPASWRVCPDKAVAQGCVGAGERAITGGPPTSWARIPPAPNHSWVHRWLKRLLAPHLEAQPASYSTKQPRESLQTVIIYVSASSSTLRKRHLRVQSKHHRVIRAWYVDAAMIRILPGRMSSQFFLSIGAHILPIPRHYCRSLDGKCSEGVLRGQAARLGPTGAPATRPAMF